jgi:murein tripeptide amidase MpaA
MPHPTADLSPQIISSFDGGTILPLGAADGRVALAIEPDNAADFRQWFCFQARGPAGHPRRFAILNAGETTYPEGFEGYAVMASYDQRRWFRVPTSFDGEVLEFFHTPRGELVTYAYFAPYSLDRQQKLLRRVARGRGARVEVLGHTPQGRPLSLVTVGEASEGRRSIWVIARQHPGETMAEWFAEGLLRRLLDEEDELVQALLERAVFHVVPNMNPDGGYLGNLRTNALGVDLNRTWNFPVPEGPEVALVRERMHREGVDLFLDIHGDERNPYCFLAGCEGNPGYSPRLAALEALFEQAQCASNADFQDEYKYPRDAPGEGDLSCASNYVGEVFDCLSFTLEMPFKDNASAPDEVAGWSPERSMHLGESTLESIAVTLDAI